MTDDSELPEVLYPEWQLEYEATLLEVDNEELSRRVIAAETAIFKRLQSISRNPELKVEQRAIEDALASLRILKRDSLGFPDWKKE